MGRASLGSPAPPAALGARARRRAPGQRLLGHGGFHRLRVGIGHPGHKDRVTPWVLGRPDGTDETLILRAIDDAIDVVPLAVGGDFNEAMKRLHTPK